MSAKDLLIELGSEELPPKFLLSLSENFKALFEDALCSHKLSFGDVKLFATPRRIAIVIESLATKQADFTSEKKGPPTQAAYKDGNPTPALIGFAKSCGVEIDALQTLKTDKGEWFVYEEKIVGKETTAIIPEVLANVLQKLPIAKRMRWANNDFEFVRPIRWILALFGSDVIDFELMGIKSSNKTRGHRFHTNEDIMITEAKSYAKTLQEKGYVVPDFAERKALIEKHVELETKAYGKAIVNPDLLNEVTALVEWPVVLIGHFEERFLKVPQEALISTMQDNQKYFPIVDLDGNITPYFCFVTNISSKDPAKIIDGNERVIRPRFSDAEFFWNSDKDIPLENYLERLSTTIFQKELGSQKDKMDRVSVLAKDIAEKIGADKAIVEKSAELYKSDLLSNMVQEFPELQGTMGKYYALAQGMDAKIASSLEEVYWPKFAGDTLPQSKESQALAIAERLDTIVGIFSIGQIPTGSRDPYSLRRASLGILRILIEKQLDLDIKPLIHIAFSSLPKALQKEGVEKDVLDYILERMKAYEIDKGITADVYEAVMTKAFSKPLDIDNRLKALAEFKGNKEALSLVQSNKRISNILQKNSAELQDKPLDEALLQDAAEKDFYQAFTQVLPSLTNALKESHYEKALESLATLAEPLANFFDNVMVMCDDLAIRNNRLQLLKLAKTSFDEVADLSLLNIES